MPDFHLPFETVRNAFQQFRAILPLPEGGQKLVYRATHADGRVCALKIIKQDHGPQEERTIREIKAAFVLDSPYFAKIFDAQSCRIDDVNCVFILEEFVGPGS